MSIAPATIRRARSSRSIIARSAARLVSSTCSAARRPARPCSPTTRKNAARDPANTEPARTSESQRDPIAGSTPVPETNADTILCRTHPHARLTAPTITIPKPRPT